MDTGQKKINLNMLRGWQKSQLELLKVFSENVVVPQTMIGSTSGTTVSSSAMGGKMTPLIRSNLITKAYKDENGKLLWQLNEETVDRESLKDFLKNLGL